MPTTSSDFRKKITNSAKSWKNARKKTKKRQKIKMEQRKRRKPTRIQPKQKTKTLLSNSTVYRDRVVRLTPNSSAISHYAITPDGEKLYYLASFEDMNDLWKLDLRKREPSIAKKLNTGMRSLSFDKDGKTMFLLGSRGMSKMAVSSEKITPITYSAVMKLDPAAEREYMFNYVKQEEKNRFYDVGCMV